MNEQLQSALAQGATVVTANRRLARSIWQSHGAHQQARGATAWVEPAILPWSGWLSSLWEELLFASPSPPVRLGPWQELALWQRLIRESAEASELLQLDATAAVVRDAWALATGWRLNLPRAESLATADARAFAGWARRFSAICEREGWLEQARLADVLRRALAGLRLPSRVVLAGFDELTPQQHEFVSACAAAGCPVDRLELPAAPAGGRAVRAGFADPEQEIAAAARWTRALLERGTNESIGVVVPDLAARRNQVERTFLGILDPTAQLPGACGPSGVINLSAGNRLSRYPLIRSALSIIGLSAEANLWSQISTLILDPYIAGADSERTRRGSLDARLRAAGEVYVSLATLHRSCADPAAPCPLLERALQAWSAVRARVSDPQPPGQWSRTFSALLDAFGWPGERPLQSDDYQAVAAWSEVLSQLASTEMVTGSVTCKEATAQLRRIAKETMFQPDSEQAPVQILGTLEASGLVFDHLWIAGLDDEAWPAQPRPNPFLPLRQQRAAGIPHASPERELEFASLVTARLLASSPDVVLSHALHEEDRELAPSPLILPLPEIAPSSLDLWSGTTFVELVRQSRAVEQLSDEQGPPLGEARWQRGGAKVFQYQAVCPFRAFAELRLGARELESPVPGLDARQRGILIHAALEELWREVRTQQALIAHAEVGKLVCRAARAAIARLERDRGVPLPARFAVLELQRLERLVSEWLEVERARPTFEVVHPESERFAELSGVCCKVKIDRIDRLPDGRELIIDYKTGSPSIGDWQTDRPAEPQLPLYATVHQAPLAGVLFGQLKAGGVRFFGLVDEAVGITGAEPTDLVAQIERWQAVLERLGAEFRVGRAEASPLNPAKTCERCALGCLCRIAATDGEREEEEPRP